jgi:hypothetical protein
MEDIKALPLIIGELNVLILKGEIEGGVEFAGSQKIKVVNNIPSK